MAWQRLDAVSRRVLRRIERAERAVAAAKPSEIDKREKGPGAVKPPASQREVRQTVLEKTAQQPSSGQARPVMSEDMRMATENAAKGCPAPTVASRMFSVIEGGRQSTGEESVSAGRTRSAGRGLARELKLVWG